ncbi:MAG: S46 family peptidase [Calditrichaceae bacterium]
MTYRIFPFLISIILTVNFAYSASPDEGMLPLSEIQSLDLNKKGLTIDPLEIYNENGVSLIDAVVNISGCTGSFVSPEGLILTNHHCAYRAAQAASTKDNDYIKNGFLAEDRSKELPAKGYTVRITDWYKDVSDEVLSVVTGEMELAEKTKAVEKRMKEIVAETEAEYPGKRAEVSEMFIGKTYILFVYTYVKDVRMVYIPPRSIGEFGGDIDNWEWPRHNADFSYMRAYVAPDGSPADYSENNIPYTPKKYLQASADGVDEEDFVFILGYPGRTYRHRSSHFLAYEQAVRMPFVVDWYQWQISLMKEIGKNDRAVALKHLARIKGLANTEKNYRGKLQGMNRLSLVDKKREEEKHLQEFINADAGRKEKFGTVLQDIGKVYNEKRETADREMILYYLVRNVNMMNFANTVYQSAVEREKPDVERESAYMDRNFDRTKARILQASADYYELTDKSVLKEMLLKAAALPGDQQIKGLKRITGSKNPEKSIDKFINSAYKKSELNNRKYLEKLFTQTEGELKKSSDPFIKLVVDLQPEHDELKEINRNRAGAIRELSAKLTEARKLYFDQEFIPDANSTLRLTYGRIRGYSPADAVYNSPITSLTGVIEKNTGEEPFDIPQKIVELHRKRDFGQFKHKALNNVPVAILYNMDTTGGNSGSPILNTNGEMVGINFDRTFEATINDFAWSESYSRSIGVDIRYVLWITQKFAGAQHLLDEMGIGTGI